MKLYRTRSVVESVRKAYAAYTHVQLHCCYVNIRPIIVDTDGLDGLPVYAWAAWQKASDGQLARWRERGGVLLQRGQFAVGQEPIQSDALVFIECPLTVAHLEHTAAGAQDEAIVPVPHTWAQHELTIDLRFSSEMQLRALWAHCRGQRTTDQEIADLSGVPKQHVMRMRKAFRPKEEWEIKARLAPENAALLPAWEWIGKGRTVSKQEVRESGHKIAVHELARLGHIKLLKYLTFPENEPNWNKLAEKRAQAIEGLDQIRALVESLPEHLPVE